jgi:hypothetical protein
MKLKNWIDECKLLDMGFKGPRYTWHRNGTYERLDRGLCNTEWQMKFPPRYNISQESNRTTVPGHAPTDKKIKNEGLPSSTYPPKQLPTAPTRPKKDVSKAGQTSYSFLALIMKESFPTLRTPSTLIFIG